MSYSLQCPHRSNHHVTHTQYTQALAQSSHNRGVLLPGRPLGSEWQATESVNAARKAARAVRDARQLGKADTPEEQEAMLKWAQSRSSLKA